MKNYQLLLVFLLCLFSLPSFAQNSKLDSLINRLASSEADTNRIRLLTQLAAQYWSTEPEKVREYATQALALSEKLGDKKRRSR